MNVPQEKAHKELGPERKEALDRFLTEVERRAFKMARFATDNTDEALDLMQEAMLRFVRLYANRPEAEWHILFYRTLQSRITDWHRRATVRKRFLSFFGQVSDKEEGDPFQGIADTSALNPAESVFRTEFTKALQKALRKLPLRQQQAFLMRAWEGMDVAETAHAMGCSEGSVKTHYSRAVHTLRGLLEDFRP